MGQKKKRKREVAIPALRNKSRSINEIIADLETLHIDELTILLQKRQKAKHSGKRKVVRIQALAPELAEHPLNEEEIASVVNHRVNRVTTTSASKLEVEEEKKGWTATTSQQCNPPTTSSNFTSGLKEIPPNTSTAYDFLKMFFTDEIIDLCVNDINIILDSVSIPSTKTRKGEDRKRHKPADRKNGYIPGLENVFQINNGLFYHFLVALLQTARSPRKRVRDYWGESGRQIRRGVVRTSSLVANDDPSTYDWSSAEGTSLLSEVLLSLLS